MSLQHRRLAKEREKVAQRVAAVLPGAPGAVSGPLAPVDVTLPPAPDPEAPDWSDATKIREYLQSLAVKVAAGTIPVSVAEMLRKLADSTLKVVDIEIDALIAERLQDAGNGQTRLRDGDSRLEVRIKEQPS